MIFIFKDLYKINSIFCVLGEEKLIDEVDGKDSIFKCDHCDYITHMQEVRGVHMYEKHNDSTKVMWYKCDKCNYKCKQRRTMEVHQNKKHGNSKSQDKIFKFDEEPPKEDKITFQFEEQDLLNKDPKDLKIVPTKVLLQCEQCPEPKRTFAYYAALKIHNGKHHPNTEIDFIKRVIEGNDGLYALMISEEGQKTLFTCHVCDQIFHMEDLYGLHLKKAHGDTSRLLYFNCDKCDYRAQSRGNLVNHKRLVHENYRPKKCSQCERRFGTKAALEDHIQSAHGTEGHLCNDCGKLFSSKKLLDRHHVWYHNPEKAGGPATCHICGKVSAHKYALTKHIYRVHKKFDKKIHGPCHLCGKSFYEKRSLKIHLMKVHGQLYNMDEK